jgi:hypothetical protein
MRLGDRVWECRSHPLHVPRATYRKLPACGPRPLHRRQTTCRVEPQPRERPAYARAKRRTDVAVKCRGVAQSRPWSCRPPESGPASAMRPDGRAAIRIALGDIRHDHLSSVMLLEVDPAGIAVLEFERDAPRPIYMDRIARGPEAPSKHENQSQERSFPAASPQRRMPPPLRSAGTVFFMRPAFGWDGSTRQQRCQAVRAGGGSSRSRVRACD